MRCLDCLKMGIVSLTGKGISQKDHGASYYPQAGLCQGGHPFLVDQRTENKELAEAITRQRQVAFLVDDHQIKVEMAKRRLSGVMAILALKTAQINFLAS